MNARNRSVLALMTILLLAAAWLSAAGVARAQEQEGPPSQYERVKGLEPFLGFWQGEFQPPHGPEGTVTGLCRWSSNRSYAQFQWFFRPEGDSERMHVATIILGWNGQEKGLHAWSFFPEGHSGGVASLESGVLTVAARGTTAEGEATSADVTYEISADKLTVTVKNAKHGDEDLPGYSFTVVKRQRPQRDAP